MITFASIFDWLPGFLFRRTSVFKVGQAVVTHKDGPMMVITTIHLGAALRFPLIECQWYDPETQSNRTSIFRESNLLDFDWYAAKQKLKPS